MNKIILSAACLLAIVLAVSALPAVDLQCGEHEVLMQCGTACPEHCPAYNARGQLETQSHICTKQCVRGCFCTGGYVKDLKRNGACVARSACTAP